MSEQKCNPVSFLLDVLLAFCSVTVTVCTKLLKDAMLVFIQ